MNPQSDLPKANGLATKQDNLIENQTIFKFSKSKSPSVCFVFKDVYCVAVCSCL